MTNPADKEAVLAANQAFYSAFAERDLKIMTSLWWQGSTSICIHPGSTQILHLIRQKSKLKS